jgi:hypothetical protein
MRKVNFWKVLLALALFVSFLPQPGLAFHNAAERAQRQSMWLQSVPTALLRQRGGAAAGFKFAKQVIKEKNNRRKYTVEASYPQIVGAKDAQAVQFNRVVKALVIADIVGFKKDVGIPDRSVPADIQWSSFDAGYSIEYDSPDLISVAFAVSPYYAGAAHPQHYSEVLNYDLKLGRTLKLSDLFRPRSGYLQVISDYAIKALKEELGPESDSEWIATGAGPDSKNFKSWNITREGLSFTFDPYQVASYAEGEHVVVIPYATLRNVINADGPVGPLAIKGKR